LFVEPDWNVTWNKGKIFGISLLWAQDDFYTMFISWKMIFEKLFICVYLPLGKLLTENTFQSKKHLAWFPEKCFPRKFRWKTLSGSCEKFRHIILFADYIKFGPQTFDCYIYFALNIYFSISSLKF